MGNGPVGAYCNTSLRSTGRPSECARIAGRQVVDGAGTPAAGHDLTAFVERTLARGTKSPDRVTLRQPQLHATTAKH